MQPVLFKFKCRFESGGKLKLVPLILIAILADWPVVTLPQKAIAQAPQAPQAPPASTTRPMYKPGVRKRPPLETMHRGLQQLPPNIPVPIPPDAKFVTGYQSQYAAARAMTYVRMNTENTPATLVDWYRQNLKSYGWTFKERPATKANGLPSLSGTKGGITCLINFEGPIGKSMKTTAIMITFNEAH